MVRTAVVGQGSHLSKNLVGTYFLFSNLQSFCQKCCPKDLAQEVWENSEQTRQLQLHIKV